MTDETYYEAISAGSESIATALASAPDAAVPGCPGWDVDKLALHVGLIYTWAGQQVRERRTSPLEFGSLPRAPEGAERVAWLSAAGASVVDALRAAGDDDPAGAWRDRTVTAGFWRRRMAHESTVHGVDADDAVGRSRALDGGLAIDGIDELMELYLGYAKPDHPPAGRLHLVATDGAAAWTVSAVDGGLVGGRAPASGSAPGDEVVVTAPAPELLLVCWGRRAVEPSRILGDAAVAQVARAWLECFRF
jgi:uncharacterized protein (TIGR03083 family)